MNFDVSQLETLERYRLLEGGVTPRPIAWISTCSGDNVDNLAPFSFFTVASCNPPVLLYTEINKRDGHIKDTRRNLLETGECVVNIVDTDSLEKMNDTSASLAISESEFDFARVASCPSYMVKPRSVAASPVRYECTLREVKAISEEPMGGSIILLDVQHIYVRDDLYDDGIINQQLINSVGKMGGDDYSTTSNLIALERP